MLRGRRGRQQEAREAAKAELLDDTPPPAAPLGGDPYRPEVACRLCGAPLTASAGAVGVCVSCIQVSHAKVTSIPRPRYGSHLELGFPDEAPPEPVPPLP